MSLPKHHSNLTVTEKLNFQELPAWVVLAAQKLIATGYQVYLVGGAVRDLLWGELPRDWDLATDALPDQVQSLFEQTLTIGKQYGTIAVIISGHRIEVTTIREDLGYSDGRHPDQVSFGSDILVDLARRDFTINAIAYDFITTQLIDPFQGRRDLYRRILKAVGKPQERFCEDGLRMLRFYRFLATLDLRPHPATQRALDPKWLAPVSGERMRDEFGKLLLGKHVRRGLEGLLRSGLLQEFLPEVADLNNYLEPHLKHRWLLWEHTMIAVVTIQPQLHLRLAALLHDVAKPSTQSVNHTGTHFYGHDQVGAELSKTILERLRFPSQTCDTVSRLVRWHMFDLGEQASDAAIRRLIARVGSPYIPDLLELRRADLVATGRADYRSWELWQEIAARINAINQGEPLFELANLAINGRELMAKFNLQPGPLVGKVLAYLWDQVLEDPALNQKSQLVSLAETYITKNPKGPT